MRDLCDELISKLWYGQICKETSNKMNAILPSTLGCRRYDKSITILMSYVLKRGSI